ncbi:MAG: sodium:proton exchanger, partial [Jatrophihabitans sp.]
MHDVIRFGAVVAVLAVALLAAVGSSRISARVNIPAPAVFLLAASVAAQIFPGLRRLGVVADQRIVTVALVIVLFDGGMRIGWRRLRPALAGVVWLGTAGTLVTAAGMAVAAHYLFGFDWRAALLVGAALAPTDPAVVFSVLGRREIVGRTGTLLEGESGANDPVGIALMAALLAATGASGWHAIGDGVLEFVLQMGIGVVFGLAGGYGLRRLMRALPMPNESLYAVRTIAFALLLFGVATVCRGSGFLAVFLAGIAVGDLRAPYKRDIERFGAALASLGEIVAFVVLGLSVPISAAFAGDRAWVGLGLAALLVLVARPLLGGAVLWPVRLRRGERVFVLWSGLKGAVPILLGTYVVAEGVPGADRIYGTVFVVVLASVVVQGGLVPTVARATRVPMRMTQQEPWSLGMRFRDEPEGMHRFVVREGAPADGCAIGDLDLGEDAWVSLVSRSGRLLQVRRDTVLHAGDEVLVLA